MKTIKVDVVQIPQKTEKEQTSSPILSPSTIPRKKKKQKKKTSFQSVSSSPVTPEISTQQQKPIPITEPPRFVQGQGLDTSIAQAIEKLTSADNQAVMVLSNISQNGANRFGLLESIVKDFNWKWLENFCTSTLTLSAAIKGKRSDQLTEIARQPEIIAPQSSGIFTKLKEHIV